MEIIHDLLLLVKKTKSYWLSVDQFDQLKISLPSGKTRLFDYSDVGIRTDCILLFYEYRWI